MPRSSTFLRVSFAALFLAYATQASAEGPEQLYEPGRGDGDWRLEYNGQIGSTEDAPRPQTIEVFHGVSDHFALGVEMESEVEGSRLKVEEFGVGAIISLTNESAPVKAALLVQAGVTTEGDIPQLETRLIVEHERGPWAVLGNIYLRRVDADEKGLSLGYAATLHRSVSNHLAFGIEASGQAQPLSGYVNGFDEGHYVGPSAKLSWDVAEGKEVELGIKYLRRIDSGSAYRDTIRLAVGVAF